MRFSIRERILMIFAIYFSAFYPTTVRQSLGAQIVHVVVDSQPMDSQKESRARIPVFGASFV
jgi:hypothetical protein